MTKDMFEELFISSDTLIIECSPMSDSKEHYLDILDSDASNGEKATALHQLIGGYRYSAYQNQGKLTRPDLKEMVAAILELGKNNVSFRAKAGIFLVCEGAYSEKQKDYEAAFVLYQRSLKFEITDPFYKYFRLNNLGFCLNFMQRFGESEEFLRAAIAMDPNRYNALKNLGVSLEHQGRFVEAAECYYNAAFYGRGEARAVAHYQRLLERQPSLKEQYPEHAEQIKKGKEI